jgi:hypothetical protein
MRALAPKKLKRIPEKEKRKKKKTKKENAQNTSTCVDDNLILRIASRVGLTPSPTCQSWARWIPGRGCGHFGNETGRANVSPPRETGGGFFMS